MVGKKESKLLGDAFGACKKQTMDALKYLRSAIRNSAERKEGELMVKIVGKKATIYRYTKETEDGTDSTRNSG